jgi:hypothetical protein
MALTSELADVADALERLCDVKPSTATPRHYDENGRAYVIGYDEAEIPRRVYLDHIPQQGENTPYNTKRAELADRMKEIRATADHPHDDPHSDYYNRSHSKGRDDFDRTKPFETLGGLHAVIVETNLPGDFPWLGFAIQPDGSPLALIWSLRGVSADSDTNAYDLVNVKPRFGLWDETNECMSCDDYGRPYKLFTRGAAEMKLAEHRKNDTQNRPFRLVQIVDVD